MSLGEALKALDNEPRSRSSGDRAVERKSSAAKLLEILKTAGMKGLQSIRRTKSGPLGNGTGMADELVQRPGSAPESSGRKVDDDLQTADSIPSTPPPHNTPASSTGPSPTSSPRASVDHGQSSRNEGQVVAGNDVVSIYSTLPIRTEPQSLFSPRKSIYETMYEDKPWEDYVESINQNINGAHPELSEESHFRRTTHRNLAEKRKESHVPLQHVSDVVESGVLPGVQIVDQVPDVAESGAERGERVSGIAEVAMSELAVEEHVPDMVTTVNLTLGAADAADMD
jgi:hypothetical protein